MFIIVLSIKTYRPFCKYLCPLGAFYAPFNKISVLQLNVNKDKCVNCNMCQKVCDMCVNPAINPNDTECIRCGKCVSSCSSDALGVPYKKQIKKK